jgi:hypothetical protein
LSVTILPYQSAIKICCGWYLNHINIKISEIRIDYIDAGWTKVCRPAIVSAGSHKRGSRPFASRERLVGGELEVKGKPIGIARTPVPDQIIS